MNGISSTWRKELPMNSIVVMYCSQNHIINIHAKLIQRYRCNSGPRKQTLPKHYVTSRCCQRLRLHPGVIHCRHHPGNFSRHRYKEIKISTLKEICLLIPRDDVIENSIDNSQSLAYIWSHQLISPGKWPQFGRRHFQMHVLEWQW